MKSNLYWFILSFSLFSYIPVQAKESKELIIGKWNNKQSAVVLTYDDSLNVHLDKVIPALNNKGFKGTFYLTVSRDPFTKRIKEWKNVASKGHELGNHTLFHPCDGSLEGRSWVNPDYDLNKYTVARMAEEILLTNTILEQVDGLKERTYAYTCGDQNAGSNSFVDKIKPAFVAARGVQSKIEHKNNIDLFDIGAFFIDKHSGKDLIDIAKKGINQGGLVVFLFHGVGGEHNLNVSVEAHQQLLDYLEAEKDKVWVSTMVEVSRYIKNK